MKPVGVKICGLRTSRDVQAAVAAGADALGFNFHPPSPRFVDGATAKTLVAEVPESVNSVGVFVGVDSATMATTARDVGLDSVQWVGDAPFPAGDLGGLALTVAFRVRTVVDIAAIRAAIAAYPHRANLASVLIDAHVTGQYGGTGTVVPWELLAGVSFGVPLILAGGLTPENVAEAIRVVRPWAVDVASGVESAPGVKDGDAMRRFVDAVRSTT